MGLRTIHQKPEWTSWRVQAQSSLTLGVVGTQSSLNSCLALPMKKFSGYWQTRFRIIVDADRSREGRSRVHIHRDLKPVNILFAAMGP